MLHQGLLRQLSTTGASQPTLSYLLPTDRELVLGRDPSCEIVIDSDQYTSVSRRHAAIRPLDPTSANAKEWVVYDLNSANGTYINGQRLQSSQTLQSGDRITLSQGGPEFIFEHQPPTPSSPSPHPSQTRQTPEALSEILKGKDFWVEGSPTQLVIRRRIPVLGQSTWISSAIVAVLWIFFPRLLLPLYFILFLVIHGFWRYDVSYTFDLVEGKLTVTQASCFGRLLNQSRLTQHQLSDLTAVRLVRSKYEGDQGTRYDIYNIYLERENGKPLNLSILSGRNQTTAQQMVDIIDEFLSGGEDE